MQTYKASIASDASYNDIVQNLTTHSQLKNIYECACQGSAFFVYKGCTRQIVSILPGGQCHIVPLTHSNPIHGISTKPGLIYIFGYT